MKYISPGVYIITEDDRKFLAVVGENGEAWELSPGGYCGVLDALEYSERTIPC